MKTDGILKTPVGKPPVLCRHSDAFLAEEYINYITVHN